MLRIVFLAIFAFFLQQNFASYQPNELKYTKLLEMIDENKNGLLTLTELKNWMTFNRNSEIEQQWENLDPENAGKVSWTEYRENVEKNSPYIEYYLDETYSDGSPLSNAHEKWFRADENKDGLLTKKEFGEFLFPNFEEPVINENDFDNPLLDWTDFELDFDQSNLEDFTNQQAVINSQFPFEKDTNEEFIEMDINKKNVKTINDVEYDAENLLNTADLNQDTFLSIDEILENHHLFDSILDDFPNDFLANNTNVI